MVSRQTRGPRAPGILYSLLAVLVLSVVGVMTVAVSQPPPPTIAEFSPQAQERIEDAPEEQTSAFGADRGASSGEEATDEPMTPATRPEMPEVEVPRVRSCVGDPPRQIEDPQAPPCVPYWEGDNGGATWKGVTGDEVRVAVPKYDQFQNEGFHERLEAFFNRRFEFYGRRLRLIPVGVPASDNPGERAAAAEADEEHQVFASTAASGGSYAYYLELARRQIPSFSVFSEAMTEEVNAQWHPYLWTYYMANDRIFANLGEWACARLVGREAVHAGDPLLASQERVFGVIFVAELADQPVDIEPLEAELSRCGEQVAASVHIVRRETTGEGGTPNEQITNAILQMREAGVTSIFALWSYFEMGNGMRSATAQGYFPEWLVSSFGFLDDNFAMHALAGDQRMQMSQIFGLSQVPKQVSPPNHPLTWAMQEVDPNFQYQEPGLRFAYGVIHYRELLLLASAIQMAGPTLTPEAIGQGLHRTAFPNPDHPIMAGSVGFMEGDHSMVKDSAEIWWGNQARGPYGDQVGAYCYVAGGVRHAKGAWPSSDENFFEPPCDSGAM